MDETRDETRKDASSSGSGSTLEQLSAEVARMGKRGAHFETHNLWSDKQLQAHQTELGLLGRRTRVLFAGAGLLLALFVGCGFWGYQRIQAAEAAVDRLPDPQTLVARVDARVDEFADRLADLSAEGEIIGGFGDRIAALETTSQTTLDALRAQVDQAAKIEAEVRLDTARRLDELTPRIEAVESSGEQAEARLSGVEEGLVTMRQDLASDVALLELQTAGTMDSFERRVAGNERGLEAVSWEVGKERLDFELFEDYRLEVAPGVVLNISDIDVPYQKVNGWLHMVSEGRILRIHDQPVQQALVFYGPDEERSYELVFTRIRPDVAIGYVRVPSEDGVRTVNQARNPDFEGQVSEVR